LDKKSLSLAVATSASCLLASYIISVASACYPFSILEPSWQLNFATNAVDNGGIALIALLLFAFSANLNSRTHPTIYQRLFKLAVWPMIGFFLIPPLYIVAGVRLQEKLRSDNVSRFEKASRRLEELGTKISNASSSKDIDLILRKFQGKGLTSSQLNLPTARIRSELLSQLQEARRQLLRQIPPEQVLQPLPLIINGTRIILSSIAYAIAFSSLARRSKAKVSLLEELGGFFESRRAAANARQRERQAFLKTIADSQLEQKALAAAERGVQSDQNAVHGFGPDNSNQFHANPPNATSNKQDSTPKRQRAVDQDYFEALSQEQDSDSYDGSESR
jgi:hypothetical protein